MDNLFIAFFLTLLAGLSTGIGGLIALFSNKNNKKFLSFTLGFSAGIMIYVSMIEIFDEAKIILSNIYGLKTGTILTVSGFFFGMFVIGLIDKLIPEDKNPHETVNLRKDQNHQKLLKTGLFTALAVGIHNFPEGLATFVSVLQDLTFALPIVIAIAIHNIPEGIAVAMPIYYATNDKKKAFFYSFISGLSEPIGAVIGYAVLMPFLNETLYGLLFAFVAGIMVFISLDELLPTAREYGEHHLSIYGLVSGMMIMAISLILFI